MAITSPLAKSGKLDLSPAANLKIKFSKVANEMICDGSSASIKQGLFLSTILWFSLNKN